MCSETKIFGVVDVVDVNVNVGIGTDSDVEGGDASLSVGAAHLRKASLASIVYKVKRSTCVWWQHQFQLPDRYPLGPKILFRILYFLCIKT